MKKEFIIKKSSLNKEVTFIPVQTEMDFDASMEEPVLSVPRGVYDIDYVIKFCQILIEKIEKLKFNQKEIGFTLTHSLKKMLAFLQVEKDQMK